MRKILARIIMIFAKFVTINMRPLRRNSVFLRVRDEIQTKITTSTSSGKYIQFQDNTDSTLRIIQNCQEAELDTIGWIDSMPEDGVLWDIGGNIGFFTLYAAFQLNGESIRVVSFEPAAANYGAINRNIEENEMADHAVAYCIALAGSTRIGRLNMDSEGRGTEAGSFHNGFETEIGTMDRQINTKFRQGSVGFSIDDFVEIFGPPLPTHIKMDVDGIEAEILKGGWRTLSAKSVRSMIVEMEGDLDSDRNRQVFDLMDQLGFVPQRRASSKYRNVIFDRQYSRC